LAKINVGKNHSDVIYGWDNEYGQYQAEIAEFQASKYLVSNQEFLGFVEDDGYQNDSYWQKEGLQWRDYSQAEHPTFWLQSEHGWQCRLMTEIIDMPWDWPVDVNYHEAKAFCNWKAEQLEQSVRLPTENEWFRMYDFSDTVELQSGQQATANIHLDHAASSCPVNRFAQGELYDVVGNVWQWTETTIHLMALKCILFMMISLCRHLMVAIISLKVARGFLVVMKAVTQLVMHFANIFFNMLASDMLLQINLRNKLCRIMETIKCYQNMLNFIMVTAILMWLISPKHWLN
jgi:hypothetical protein